MTPEAVDTDTARYFVRVVEIWEPTHDGSALCIRDAHYGDCEAFGRASAGVEFERGIGLPGRVWATGRPVVLDGLISSHFQRVLIAGEAGLGAGVGIPILCDGVFRAALVLLLAVEQDLNGVAEVWQRDPQGLGLALDTSFHGGLSRFARDTQQVRFAQGQGLPGLCWLANQPVLVSDVRKWPDFQRRLPAEAEAVTSGIGIPMFDGPQLTDVVTLFGTRNLDLMRRAQVWEVGGEAPKLHASITAPSVPDDAAKDSQNLQLVARAARTRSPQLGWTPKGTAVAIPVILGGRPSSVLTLEI